MERSEIRDRAGFNPDCATLHPDYKLNVDRNEPIELITTSDGWSPRPPVVLHSLDPKGLNPMHFHQSRGLIAAIILIGLAGAALAQVKHEPAMGALKEGQVVLVDDGSCPKGQIKRVVGGNHFTVGGFKKIERKRSCVPR
jgi:hypothetical protein